MENLKWVLIDSETVGLDVPPPPASGVVQFAYMELNPDTLERSEIYSHLVNPGCPISPDAEKIHGKSWDMVKDQPPLEYYRTDDPVIFIAHNAAFDLKFLGGMFDNLHGDMCSLKLARHYFPESPNHKLQTLADHLGIEKGQAHDAGGDIFTTYGLLCMLVERSGVSLRTLYERSKITRTFQAMPFGKYKGMHLTKVPVGYIQWLLEREIDADLRKTLNIQIKLRG